ncbi:MAG TPA: hypothetical protein VMV46_04820 [Thermoanaerobaculia bacterium]|nr:hypothetical protein [Thermoanaerobaculia bacterium]
MASRTLPKTLLVAALALAFFTAGILLGAAGVEKPSSVIHVVTVD